MTMRERIARALSKTLLHHGVVLHPEDVDGLVLDALAAMREPTDAMKAAGREAFLEDMRDRRLLKWLFPTRPADHGAIGYVEGPIDLETQMDCASTNSGKSWQAQIDAAKEER